MENELQATLASWKNMRQLTLDLLEAIPEEQLSFSVGKNMGTIGKQFRHIGDVQICYSEAMKSGKIDFDKYRRDYALEGSKEKLKEFLLDVDKEMIGLVEADAGVTIDWYGEAWTMSRHLRALVEHEILHHGELVVYFRTLDLSFPESWDFWGL